MKNFEVIATINNIERFINREVENNKAFINTQAKFKLRKNFKAFKNIYEIYNECLKESLTKYEIQPQKDGSIKIDKDNPNAEKIQTELQELLNTESEVVIEKISINDFSEDCLLGDMELLNFMTIEEAAVND